MDGVTLPAISKKRGWPLSRLERLVLQYASEVGEPTRIGHWRLWPAVIEKKFEELIDRESRCAAGGPR